MRSRLVRLAARSGRSRPRILFIILALATTLNAQNPAAGQSPNLDAFIRQYATEHNFDGAVLVQENRREIYRGSFGIANRAFDVPIKDDTLFRIASITKAFTAVLVLQLYDEGKIDLDKTIGFYLPAYSGEARDRATIRNLLNHTSGIQNIDAGLTNYEEALKNGIEHYQMPFTTDQLVSRFCSGKLVNEPGKVFDYNNGEYIILGKIVEKVTGKPFDDVLIERVLQPLGMKHTGMVHQQIILENLADTYTSMDKGKTFVNDMPVYPENWFASGAMYSTTSDLLSFANALFGGKLLKADTLELMLKPGLDGYGYSVWIGSPEFDGKSYRAVNRPGGVMGANGSLRHFSGIGFDESVDVIILSNTNATDLDGFSWDIGKTVLGRK